MSLTQVIAAMVFTAITMIWDLRTRRIPNLLNVFGLVAALVVSSAERGLSGLQFSLAGFGTGFGILVILWLMGGVGGGDVKLMGAVGAWLGPYLTLIVFVASGLLAALGQIGLRLFRPTHSKQRTAVAHENLQPDLPGTSAPESQNPQKLPYAVPVAVAVWTFLATKLVKHLAPLV